MSTDIIICLLNHITFSTSQCVMSIIRITQCYLPAWHKRGVGSNGVYQSWNIEGHYQLSVET